MRNKSFLKFIAAVIVGLSIAAIVAFCGCTGLFGDSDLFSVRNKADKLRSEMTTTLGEGFISRDVAAVKALFCEKSQEISDIDEQIENTFAFIDGNVRSYRIGERGYESFGIEEGAVTDYEFDSTVFLTADSEKEYCLTFRAWLVADRSIKGMTAYSLTELYRTDYEFRRAGYYWESPYDSECGKLSANIIKLLGSGDESGIKELLCPQISEGPETDGRIRLAAEAFEGTPLFTEREDGLYDLSDSEEDFSCTVLACNALENKSGELASVWLRVLVRNIVTDSGKKYSLDLVLYLKNLAAPQYEGISYFSLSDEQTNQTLASVGEWIRL